MLDIEKIKKHTMAKLKSHFAKKFDAIESLTKTPPECTRFRRK